MEQIIQLDKELFLYLNNLGQTQWDVFWIVLSERTTWIPLYIALLLLLYVKLGWRKTALILVLSLLMVLFTDQITNLFKSGFQRYRPCHTPEFDGLMRRVDCVGRGRFGFTSAHASNHFGLALFLGLILRSYFKWILGALLIWAAFIAYSRVYLGVHFPLDVFCGGILGLVLARLNYALYQRILKKYPGKFKG